jgi:hypothetical protein
LSLSQCAADYQMIVPTISFSSPGNSFNWATVPSNIGLGDNYFASFTAILTVTVAGDYTFFTTSDDGSWLVLSGSDGVQYVT